MKWPLASALAVIVLVGSGFDASLIDDSAGHDTGEARIGVRLLPAPPGAPAPPAPRPPTPVVPAPLGQTPIALTGFAPGAVLSEPTVVDATAGAESAIDHLVFRVDGAEVQIQRNPPYRWVFDPSGVAAGLHTMSVEVVRVDGRPGPAPLSRSFAVAGPEESAFTLTGLESGDVVTAPVVLDVEAAALQRIASVRFHVDGALTDTQLETPYRWRMDPAAIGQGVHVLTATVTDAAGTTSTLSRPFVTVSASGGPRLSLPGLVDGAELGAPTDLDALATDPDGIEGVRFYVDGLLTDTQVNAPYLWTLDPARFATGEHSLSVVATDGAGGISALSRRFVVSVGPDDDGGGPVPNPGPPGDSAQLAWSSTGPISAGQHPPFGGHQVVAPDRMVAVADPLASAAASLASPGRQVSAARARIVARFTVKDGDKGGGSQSGERNEIYEGGHGNPPEVEGSSAYYSIGLLFPQDFSAPTWTILHQMHGSYRGSSPVVAIQADKGNELQVIQRGGNPSSPRVVRHKIEANLTRNVWHQFVYFVNWDAGAGGVLKVWHRRAGMDARWTLVVDDHGPVGYRNSSGWFGPYPKLGIYRSSDISGTTTVYHLGMRLRASSFADAAGLFGAGTPAA